MQSKIKGAGLGLRSQYFNYIVKNKPSAPWFEILSDNYLGNNVSKDSIFYNNLSKILENYPVTLHCVGMSLGSAKGIDKAYLTKLNKLIEFTKPLYISDHVSWGNIGGFNSHELLPLPYTDESLDILVKNIKDTQNFLGRKILVENVSSYISYKFSKYKEWDFLNKVADLSGCGILLDINNIYVNSVNHKFNPHDFLNNINKHHIEYYHLAGHEVYSEDQNYLIDTHGEDIIEPVWELLIAATNRIGYKPCLLERDNNIPDFNLLDQERKKIEFILTAAKNKEKDLV